MNLKAANEGQTEVHVEIEFISGPTEFTIRRILDSEFGDEKGKVLRFRRATNYARCAAKRLSVLRPMAPADFSYLMASCCKNGEELMEPTTETAKNKAPIGCNGVLLQKTLQLLDGV